MFFTDAFHVFLPVTVTAMENPCPKCLCVEVSVIKVLRIRTNVEHILMFW